MFCNSMHDNFYDQYLAKLSILLLAPNYIFYDIKLKTFFAPKLEMILLFHRDIDVRIILIFISMY